MLHCSLKSSTQIQRAKVVPHNEVRQEVSHHQHTEVRNSTDSCVLWQLWYSLLVSRQLERMPHISSKFIGDTSYKYLGNY